MEFLLILILLAIIIGYFLFSSKSSSSPDTQIVEASYVCDECNEFECICRKEDDQ